MGRRCGAGWKHRHLFESGRARKAGVQPPRLGAGRLRSRPRGTARYRCHAPCEGHWTMAGGGPHPRDLNVKEGAIRGAMRSARECRSCPVGHFEKSGRPSVTGSRMRYSSSRVPTLRATCLGWAGPTSQFTASCPDLDALYLNAGCAIAPVKVGAGLQTKVPQAMLYGLPVVATSFSAGGLGQHAVPNIFCGST